MSKRARRKRTKAPKSKLGLPDLDRSKAAVLDRLAQPRVGSQHSASQRP